MYCSTLSLPYALPILSPEIVQAVRGTDLFWMVVPRELGGLNMDAAAAIEVWEEISRADASAGWSLMANALATGMAAAFLGDDAILRMFGGSEKPVMGGMAGPGGSAVPENGGYRGRGKRSGGQTSEH